MLKEKFDLETFWILMFGVDPTIQKNEIWIQSFPITDPCLTQPPWSRSTPLLISTKHWI
mgnify:CR=1 FL=1